MILAMEFKKKIAHFKLFMKNLNLYVLSLYILNKIAVCTNNGLSTASEPGAGTPAHVPVHTGEY